MSLPLAGIQQAWQPSDTHLRGGEKCHWWEDNYRRDSVTGKSIEKSVDDRNKAAKGAVQIAPWARFRMLHKIL